MVVAVDPEDLRRAAGALRAAVAEIYASVARHALGLGGPGPRAWESATRLEAAARVFDDHLRTLVTGLDRTAARIEAAADGFIAADQAAAGAWRSAACTH